MKKTSILIIMLIVSCCLLGVGYATVTDVTLDIEGQASMPQQSGVVISEVDIVDSYNVNPNFSRVNTYYQTLLDTRTELGNDLSSYITYEIEITNLSSESQVFKGIEYDPNYYDNNDIDYILTGLNINEALQPNQTATVLLRFKYKNGVSTISDNVLNSVLNFKFELGSNVIDYIEYSGLCVFSGQNQPVVGNCATGQNQQDYIDTGIALFSSELYDKDFEIGFTIETIDDSRFRTGKVDTIFNCLYDQSPYPGITFRIENSKWLLQAGTGDNNTKYSFNKGSIQSFKLFRRNGIIYYSVNGGTEQYYADLTTFNRYFNDTLIFGTAQKANGTMYTDRYLIATLSDIYVKVLEPEGGQQHDYTYYDQLIEQFIGEPMTTAYDDATAHVYDGTTATTTSTGVSLFDANNWDKSWVVTFEIEDFNFSQQVQQFAQATIFNAKNEDDSPYVGMTLRKQSAGDTSYTLLIRSNDNISSTVSIPSGAKRINFIKKGMDFYYQFDYSEILRIGSNNSFDTFTAQDAFNTEATFGSVKHNDGTYDRMIVGTLSNMRIKIAS